VLIDRGSIRQFRTGVCLHGHTMHSEECLSFLPRYLHHVPGISQIVSRYERGTPAAVDFSRAYWTPPLTPASALNVEREQIANLGLVPLVSLTDHDNIDAGVSLQAAYSRQAVPLSVEWTVPYYRSIVHLGIHNLPAAVAPSWTREMAAYTAAPNDGLLREILCACARIPDVLIVLNHPFWLEEGVEESDRRDALDRMLDKCLAWFHAFELNGTRQWRENAATIELAKAYSRPIISGGDRHACEPSACINLTNAESFSEFVAEIRDGHSPVLFMPHYQRPMALRILEASTDILRTYPEFPGRERWMDRFFYRSEDGVAQSLATLWRDREPWVLRPATRTLQTWGRLLNRRRVVNPPSAGFSPRKAGGQSPSPIGRRLDSV
jgi:hypothetical protein